jgi:hypothetical protein
MFKKHFNITMYFSVSRVVSSHFPAKVPTINANYASHIDLYLIAIGLVYQTAHRRVPKGCKIYIPRRDKKSHP